MKKLSTFIPALVLALLLFGCTKQPPAPTETFEGNLNTYCAMSDGTWECGGYIYKYRHEISGRMPNAAVDSTFVYLSNLETISFDRAYMAAGLSSNLDDYFAVEDAVLVDCTWK